MTWTAGSEPQPGSAPMRMDAQGVLRTPFPFSFPDSEGDLEDDYEDSGSEEDPDDPYSSRDWRDRLW